MRIQETSPTTFSDWALNVFFDSCVKKKKKILVCAYCLSSSYSALKSFPSNNNEKKFITVLAAWIGTLTAWFIQSKQNSARADKRKKKSLCNFSLTFGLRCWWQATDVYGTDKPIELTTGLRFAWQKKTKGAHWAPRRGKMSHFLKKMGYFLKRQVTFPDSPKMSH